MKNAKIAVFRKINPFWKLRGFGQKKFWPKYVLGTCEVWRALGKLFFGNWSSNPRGRGPPPCQSTVNFQKGIWIFLYKCVGKASNFLEMVQNSDFLPQKWMGRGIVLPSTPYACSANTFYILFIINPFNWSFSTSKNWSKAHKMWSNR